MAFGAAVGAPLSKVNNIYYTRMKVQVKPKVTVNKGMLSTNIAAANF